MYNVTVMGASAVGKSSLVIQFVQNKFISNYNPTIEDQFRRQLTVQNQSIMLNVCDTAGQDAYGNVRDGYIQQGRGFIIVFSVDELSSFEEALVVQEHVERVKEGVKFPMVFAANKTDLPKEQWKVGEEQLNKLAELGIVYLETSAKTRTNVDELFLEVGRQMLKADLPAHGLNAAPASAKKKKICQ